MPAPTDAAVVNLRRAYFECRYGQLHVRTAFPSTGGFDEATPLVCLHEGLRSSASFAPLLPVLGTDRSIYACDVPGCGLSDPPAAAPAIGDYAAAIGDFLDALRLREADVFGIGAGAAIAVELALLKPRGVRRVVLARLALPVNAPAPATEPAADGSHLARDFAASVARRGREEPLAALTQGFAAELAGGVAARWSELALGAWPAEQRLPQLTQPTLLLGPAPAAAARIAKAVRAELPAAGAGFIAAAPAALGKRLRDFLGS
jgi:pimeloyl-ACP methyl ester carboxylesterase